MPFRVPFAALISVAAVAAPVAVASSSAPSFAQTVEQTLTAPTTPAVLVVPAAANAEPVPDAQPDPTPDPRHVECVAKVILHEAAYEPREGRVAVAQVIRARIKDGRFAANACAVARQRGQFFDIDSFNPSRGTERWDDAVAIAAHTLSGAGDEVAPGALFFHAAYAPMRGRTRVTQIGGHVFYR